MCFFLTVNIHAGKITVYLISRNFSLGVLQHDGKTDFAGDNSSFNIFHQIMGRRPNSSGQRESTEDRGA